MVWELTFILQDLKGVEVCYFCSLDHTGKDASLCFPPQKIPRSQEATI